MDVDVRHSTAPQEDIRARVVGMTDLFLVSFTYASSAWYGALPSCCTDILAVGI
jgi:hypothetical protein